MTPEHDILILGAGCAGLSAVVHLLEVGLGDRRVTIVDPRTEFGRDRTWCFFRVAHHPFEDAVAHRWHRWRVRDAHRVTVRESALHPYQHLPSDAFYRRCLARIDASDRVELRLGVRADAVEDRGDVVRVTTDRGELRARVVLDGRPQAVVTRRRPGDVRLLQHFVGWFIRTEEPQIDPDVVTLMDFSVDQGDGIHFVYVLPFSEHDALVEDTYFSFDPLPEERHEATLAHWLDRRGIVDYEVVHRERGALPMSTEEVEQSPSPRVLRIGLAGGLARPATGYAFLAIQRHARELARRLVRAEVPRPPRARAPRTVALDRIFLSHLARHPERAPALFVRMFERTPPDVLARFLSEASSVADEGRVMAALPPLPFAAEALRSSRLWLARS